MIALETNVLVRFLTQDDPDQPTEVDRLISRLRMECGHARHDARKRNVEIGRQVAEVFMTNKMKLGRLPTSELLPEGVASLDT